VARYAPSTPPSRAHAAQPRPSHSVAIARSVRRHAARGRANGAATLVAHVAVYVDGLSVQLLVDLLHATGKQATVDVDD
jgi:hypothetical protein